MKKIGCFLMLFALVFVSTTGLAEEAFSIHSGVQFGMSVEEVSALEKEAGFEMEECTQTYADTKAAEVKSIKGMVAGIDKSEIQYAFNNEGKIFAATYILGNLFTPGESDYAVVESSLTKKYGEPDNIWLPIVDRIGYEPLNYLRGWVEGRNLPDNSTWAVQTENGDYVIICHYKATASFGSSLSSLPPMIFNIVGYQLYSADELNKEISQASDEANEILEQRDNDL